MQINIHESYSAGSFARKHHSQVDGYRALAHAAFATHDEQLMLDAVQGASNYHVLDLPEGALAFLGFLFCTHD
jgi:hypothetical protein